MNWVNFTILLVGFRNLSIESVKPVDDCCKGWIKVMLHSVQKNHKNKVNWSLFDHLKMDFYLGVSLKIVWKHNLFIPDDQNCFDNPNAMVSVHIGSTSIHFINCYLQISLYEYWCSLETDLCRKMGQSNVTSLVFHWINDSTGNYDQGTNF